MTRSDDPALKQLLELRTYHTIQVQRCDDAIALLQDLSRMTRKADRVLGRAAQRVNAEAARAPSATVYAGPRGGRTPGARRSAMTRAGQTPIQQVKRALIDGATLTPEQMVEIVLPHVLTPRRGGRRKLSKDGLARRAVGVIMSRLAADKLVKPSGDGFSATAKLLAASQNGAEA